LAKDDKIDSAIRKQEQDIEHLEQRLSMLDDRLDNIDSVVSAVVERVMKQPVTINIVCPNCGKRVEIALVANEKPTG